MYIIPVLESPGYKPEAAFKHVQDVKKCAKILVYLNENGNVTKMVKNLKKTLDLIAFLAPIPFGKSKNFFILFEIGFGRHRPHSTRPAVNTRHLAGFSHERIKLFTLDKPSFLEILPTISDLMQEITNLRTSHWKSTAISQRSSKIYTFGGTKKRIDYYEVYKTIFGGIVYSIDHRDNLLIEIFQDLEVYINKINRAFINHVGKKVANRSLARYKLSSDHRTILKRKGCNNLIDYFSSKEWIKYLLKQPKAIEEIVLLTDHPYVLIQTLEAFNWFERTNGNYYRLFQLANRNSKNPNILAYKMGCKQYAKHLNKLSSGLQVRRTFNNQNWKRKRYATFLVLPSTQREKPFTRSPAKLNKKEVVPF